MGSTPGAIRRAGWWLVGSVAALVPAAALAQERVPDWGWACTRCGGCGALGAQGRASGSDSAMQILRERYARGDISREEFEAKRRDLEP